jgi:hypothetical protein
MKKLCNVPDLARGQNMDELFWFAEAFRTHFIEMVSALLVTAALLVVILTKVLPTPRAGVSPKTKFGPDSTPLDPWYDQMAQRDRDLDKWRAEHKAHFEH